MPPTRLIDLHCDWLLQYAGESTLFDPSLYQGVESRLGQSESYLQSVSAAVFSCFRTADDWRNQRDPRPALAGLLARLEAEFPGRLLIGPDDWTRWRDDPDGLCWGVIGVEGFDDLIRSSADLDQLPALFERGVRVFQPVYSADNLLAGSSAAGDSRGLTERGRSFLRVLSGVPGAGRPALDLAHMNPVAASEVLTWFEAEPSRADLMIPVYSHGALRHEGFQSPRAMTPENLARLRALGGVIGFSIGPPFYPSSDVLKAGIEATAALPFRGRAGFEGIAIGTDFLGVDATLPGLGTAEQVVRWLQSAFDPATATALISENARTLLGKLTGPTIG